MAEGTVTAAAARAPLRGGEAQGAEGDTSGSSGSRQGDTKGDVKIQRNTRGDTREHSRGDSSGDSRRDASGDSRGDNRSGEAQRAEGEMSDGSSGSRKGDSLDTGEAQHGASLEGPGRSGAAHRIPEEDLQEMMRRCSLRADGKIQCVQCARLFTSQGALRQHIIGRHVRPKKPQLKSPQNPQQKRQQHSEGNSQQVLQWNSPHNPQRKAKEQPSRQIVPTSQSLSVSEERNRGKGQRDEERGGGQGKGGEKRAPRLASVGTPTLDRRAPRAPAPVPAPAPTLADFLPQPQGRPRKGTSFVPTATFRASITAEPSLNQKFYQIGESSSRQDNDRAPHGSKTAETAARLQEADFPELIVSARSGAQAGKPALAPPLRPGAQGNGHSLAATGQAPLPHGTVQERERPLPAGGGDTPAVHRGKGRRNIGRSTVPAPHHSLPSGLPVAQEKGPGGGGVGGRGYTMRGKAKLVLNPNTASSTALVLRRGKERQHPKKKRLSKLKRIILQQRQAREQQKQALETQPVSAETQGPFSETQVSFSETQVSFSEAQGPLSETQASLLEGSSPEDDKQLSANTQGTQRAVSGIGSSEEDKGLAGPISAAQLPSPESQAPEGDRKLADPLAAAQVPSPQSQAPQQDKQLAGPLAATQLPSEESQAPQQDKQLAGPPVATQLPSAESQALEDDKGVKGARNRQPHLPGGPPSTESPHSFHLNGTGDEGMGGRAGPETGCAQGQGRKGGGSQEQGEEGKGAHGEGREEGGAQEQGRGGEGAQEEGMGEGSAQTEGRDGKGAQVQGRRGGDAQGGGRERGDPGVTYVGVGVQHRYCQQVITRELNEVTTGVLRELQRLQQRAAEREPQKARMRQRMACGLRESARALRAKRARCVLVAPNVEELPGEGGLDSCVNTVLELARDGGVPVVFALTKSKMGQVLGRRARMSAIAILSCDGAYKEFKEMLALAEKGRQLWLETNARNKTL